MRCYQQVVRSDHHSPTSEIGTNLTVVLRSFTWVIQYLDIAKKLVNGCLILGAPRRDFNSKLKFRLRDR